MTRVESVVKILFLRIYLIKQMNCEIYDDTNSFISIETGKELLLLCLFTSEFSKVQWLCILFLCVQDIRFISFEF